MDALVDNPAINLPPEMIVGMLQALDNSSDPVVREFHGLLQLHPISRASMAVSVSSNPPAELYDLSLKKPVSTTGLEAHPVTESVVYSASVSSASAPPPATVQDTPRTNEANPAGNASGLLGGMCSRNGRRRTTINAPRQRKQPERIAEGEVAARRVTRSSAAVVKEAEGVAEEKTDDPRGVAVVNESEFSGSEDSSDDSTESESEISGRKRKRSGKKGSKIKNKKRSKKDPPPRWLTDGSPPELHTGTDGLLIELCRVISNDGLQSLTDLTQHLIHPETCKPTADYSLELGSIIAACSREDTMQMVTDFRHMMLLIRLAFHLQR
jgi:hypothetical protein